MKLVIDIPDKEYERLDYIDHLKLRAYIDNGTPLPKGHGRLIDKDNVYNILGVYACMGGLDFSDLYQQLDDAPTVIEADTACLNSEKLNKVKQEFKQDLNKDDDEMFGDYMSPIV